MRVESDMPQPPRRRRRFSGRGRYVLIGLVVALFVLVLSLRGIARFYTDYLWFDSVDKTEVWSGVLGAKITVAFTFGALFFVLLFVNLVIAERLSPSVRPPGPEEDMLGRYHEVVGPRSKRIYAVVAVLFAIMLGSTVVSRWEEWLLFRNRVDFGVEDPEFGVDVGFYVFQLPFLSFAVSWLFAAVILVLGLTLVAHYLNGGIRFQTIGERVSPMVKAHASVLLALLALIKAADYWLQRYRLNLSSNGFVDGAAYTDVNARLPAISLLLLISVFAAGLLLVNIRRRGWSLPAVAVGLWAFVAIVMGNIYPAFVQWRTVSPAESEREAPFIERNIAATRAAYGLDSVESVPYTIDDELETDDLIDRAATVRNIRLLDPVVVRDTYVRLQGGRAFYDFRPVLDVDRYELDGEISQVVFGARELDESELGSWENRHVAFTHGYGIALAGGQAATVNGEPDFSVGDLPVSVGDEFPESIDQPGIYFGEGLGGYAIVGANRDEVDFVDDSGQERTTRYEGEGGVPIDSFIRRSAFALRFGQFEPLLSSFITGDSRVIYNRDVRSMVTNVAPFIDWDTDPYPAIVDGELFYVVDGYTTSSSYPYSQTARGEQLGGSNLGGGFNYIRNSVKAVIDAYDGEITIYRTPVEDPVVEAWAKAFPDLFEAFDAMPEGLLDNLRYPEQIFRIQTALYGAYYIDNVQDFYSRGAYWSIAQDPGREGRGATSETIIDEDTNLAREQDRRIDPYYTVLEPPDGGEAEFLILRSFVPRDPNDERKDLTAFMTGGSDPDDYGRLKVYVVEVSPGTENDGPLQADERIRNASVVAERQTLLGQQGSEVIFGEMQLVPIGDTILYVRPMYVRAEGSSTTPELEHVIAFVGGDVVLADNLQDALEGLVGGELDEVFSTSVTDASRPGDEGPIVEPDPDDPDAPVDPDDPDDPDAPVEPDEPVEPDVPLDELALEELLARIVELQTEADATLDDYAELQSQIRELLEQASEQLGEAVDPPDDSDDTAAAN